MEKVRQPFPWRDWTAHLDHLEQELQNLSHPQANQLQPQNPQSHSQKWYANTWTHYALHKSRQISQIPYYRTLPSLMNMIQQN